MKTKVLMSCILLLASVIVAYGQDQEPADKAQFEGLKLVSVAHQLAVLGYANQDPLMLITAASTLGEYPVKGDLKPDSIVLEKSSVAPFKAGAKDVKLNPYVLLDDAQGMAANDSLLLAMIDRTRNNIKEKEGLPRGRKFSPLVQEYLLGSEGKVKLWATFVANEVAEVFVMGNGSTMIDLYLYDQKGKLIGSDLKNIDNCYVSFTPQSTLQFRIEIRNSGKSDNHCLLMTN
jgi:hypothetical protein